MFCRSLIFDYCSFSRIQVLFNSGIATVLAVLIWKITGWQDKCLDSKESALVTALIGGIVGHYSCCNGDTWSSELGVLSDATPRLITTFKVFNSFRYFLILISCLISYIIHLLLLILCCSLVAGYRTFLVYFSQCTSQA